MSERNGSGVVVPTQKPADMADTERYRPKADRNAVYTAIEQGLRQSVSEAAHQAAQFVALSFYDRDQDIRVRHGHLVDASECMELAMTYLGQLKALLSHRITVDEDAANPYPVPPPGPPGFR